MANGNLFDDMMGRVDRATDSIKTRLLNDFHSAISKELSEKENVKVEKRTNSSIVVKEDTEDTNVIDLKKYFRRSAKVNRTAKGGWYLVVPIRRYTRGATKSSGMSRRMYDELRSAPGPTNQTLISDYLYTNRKVSPVPELNYEPKSKTITRIKNTQGRGNTYVSFRTVSNTSAPNSWLLNRDKAKMEDLTPRIRRIVSKVRRNNKNS